MSWSRGAQARFAGERACCSATGSVGTRPGLELGVTDMVEAGYAPDGIARWFEPAGPWRKLRRKDAYRSSFASRPISATGTVTPARAPAREGSTAAPLPVWFPRPVTDLPLTLIRALRKSIALGA
jgi:hypothetical protein